MELISAAKNGDFNTVFSLLQHGHQANVRDHDNATPLYWAACHGHASLCEVLLEGGSDVNARVKWGSTPLHAASDRGHTECVKILLENGANLNCQNNRGDTPLHIAAYRGNSDITRQLLRACADTGLQNDKGKTPKKEAVEGGHSDIAECIDRFISGRAQTFNHAHHGVGHQNKPKDAPPVRVAIHQAPPTEHETPNGIYNPAIFRSLGSGNTSVCSSCDTASGTDSYDYSDTSSVFSSVPENSRVNGVHNNLKRSISVGGHDVLQPPRHVTLQPNSTVVTKTSSMGNLPFNGVLNNGKVYENDINRTYSSVDSVCAQTPELNVVGNEPEVNNVSRVMKYSYSPDFSTKLTSNGRCVATESVDETELRSPDEMVVLRHPMAGMRLQNAAINRPMRASTGSVIDIQTHSDGHEAYIKTLQTQLVNAYKEIEKLTKEREDLKFKCSTVINRLTDTEQTLDEKTKECEMLREMVDAGRHQTVGVNGDGTADVRRSDGREEQIEEIVRLTERLNNDQTELPNLQKILQETLLTLSQRTTLTHDLHMTSANQELVPGLDYVILGENQAAWHQPMASGRVPLSLAFSIKHMKSGKRFVLKMLLVLLDPQADQWIFEPVPIRSVSTGHDCLLRHPNTLRPVHLFQGSSDRFRKFVTSPVSKSVQLCAKTLFLVTNEIMTFRTLLESINRSRDSGVCSIAEYGSFMEFIVLVMYQVLSLVCCLEDTKVVHGNISEDTIVMDKTLRPLLGDMEAALCGSSSTWLPDNSSSNPLSRGNGSFQTLIKEQFGGDLRSVCEMFQRLLVSPDTAFYLSVCDKSFQQKLAAVQHILQGAISPTSVHALSCKTVLQRVGCVLYGPRKNSVRSTQDCGQFLTTEILKTTTDLPQYSPQKDGSSCISVQESVTMRRPEVKAHFLCFVTPDELWDTYQCCFRENWLAS